MMKQLKLGREAAKLFGRLMRDKYVVADGKETKQIVYALKGAKVEVYNGYDQGAKKVVLAMEQNIRAVPLKKTLKSVIFGLKDI